MALGKNACGTPFEDQGKPALPEDGLLGGTQGFGRIGGDGA